MTPDVFYKTLQRQDSSKIVYFYTIDAFWHNDTSQSRRLADHRSGATGAENFNRVVQDAKEMAADYLEVKEFSTIKAPYSSLKHKTKISLTNIPAAVSAIAVPQMPEETDLTLYGGLGGFLKMNNEKTKAEFQNTIITAEVERLRNENAKLQDELSETEKYCDTLEEENEKFQEKIKELEKYKPGNLKIMGIDAVSLGTAVVNKAITNIVRKSPNSVKSILGLSDAQYHEFLGEITADDPAPSLPATNNKRNGDIDFETAEDTSSLTPEQKEMLGVIKSFTEWMKSLKAGQLKKLSAIMIALYDQEHSFNEDHAAQIISFIKENLNIKGPTNNP